MSAKQKDPYVIKLIGDVDESMVLKVVEDLEKWDGKSIINVHLCTDGGDIYSSHAIYDLLSRIKDKVRIIVLGKCFSAGVTILMSSNHRYATPSSYFLVHFGTDHLESEDDLNQTKATLKWTKGIMSDQLNVSKPTLTNWFKRQVYLNTDKALKVGMIRGIIDEEERPKSARRSK